VAPTQLNRRRHDAPVMEIIVAARPFRPVPRYNIRKLWSQPTPKSRLIRDNNFMQFSMPHRLVISSSVERRTLRRFGEKGSLGNTRVDGIIRAWPLQDLLLDAVPNAELWKLRFPLQFQNTTGPLTNGSPPLIAKMISEYTMEH
jgi:hypothetical protein